ncbi:MAG: glycosyltransferase family 87 protein [Acidimicrobiia bacterium]|nr:glycosyltransferase family 87 protein [Acidimicrobiia bacterium]
MTDEASDRLAWRLRIYPFVILGTMATALLFATVVFDEADPETRIGGDYPAFYSAGSIVVSGDWQDLYSHERQQREQAGLIDDEGGYLYFSYPPFVAGAYAPLALLPYAWSSFAHTLLMAGALGGAIWLLWPWLRRFGWPPTAVLVAMLAFYPLLRAVPGGQNTSLSLLLLAAAARLEHEGRPVLAGVALAAMLYKPQFGVVIVPLLVLCRRWRVLGGWSAGAAALYLLSALPLGWDWVGPWWDQATSFRDANATINGGNFVSLPGFLENASSVAAGPFAGYLLAGVLGLGVAVFWWRNPHGATLGRYALAAGAVVIAAPQTLYYDVGLLALAMVAVMAANAERYRLVVLGVLVGSWIQLAAPQLGWSPLGPVAWLAMGWLVWQALNGRVLEATPV